MIRLKASGKKNYSGTATMLRESPCKQARGDFSRRWISDDYFDLIVWYEPDGDVHGFQLCYDKPYNERALTWTAKEGFSHKAVDSGEAYPHSNCTPVLVADGLLPVDSVRREFLIRSAGLDPTIRDLVIKKLSEYESQC